jgi:GNAT superfamily N-acetyltransferase
MSVEVKEVLTLKDIKAFVLFPFDLYKGNRYWVPPIISDEIKSLQPEHNPAFRYCKTQFWLAYENNKIVGRIGAIINYEYNKKVNKAIGRFTRFECVEKIEVAALLLKTAEDWLKNEGMEVIMGPLGFNNLDHQGLLIEGFDHLPSIASEYHMPYYKDFIEQLGYKKEIDWVEFRLTIKDIPEKALKMNDLIKQRHKLNVLSFTKTKDLLPYGSKIFKVLNAAFAELFSVIAFDEVMIDYYVNRYIKLLNPKFVKLIENEQHEIIAFIIGLPSLSEAFQKARGKLFPFGFIHILKAMKHPEVVDLMLTGIEPSYQSKGVSAILITELQKTMLEHGVKYAETTGIFETNHEAINHWKSYEHIQHKRKRCFVKELC